MKVLELFVSEPMVLRLGWTLVHFVWQATLVAVIAAMILQCIKKQAASIRYAIASLSLVFIVVMAAITFTQVSVSKPLPKAGYQPALSLVQAETPSETIKSPESQPTSANTQPTFSWPEFRKSCISLAEPALPYIVIGWLVGVFSLSLMHLGGWTRLRRIRHQLTKPVSPDLEQTAQKIAHRLGVHKAFKVFESGLMQVPTAIGHMKPVILLPVSALTGLSLEQIEIIIAHELAHIKRHDYLINLFQTAIETFGFYHPAIWWLSHTIRVERENCCDDMVVHAFNNPVQYAKALTNMAKIRSRQIDLAMAANGSSLVQRIERLVSVDKQAHRRPAWLAAILSVILIAAIAIPTTVGFAAKDRRHRPASDDVTARFNEWINAIVDNDTRAFEMIAHNMCVNRSPDANEAAATESLQKQAQRLRVYAGLDHLKIISMENKGDHFDVLTSPVKDPEGVSGRFLITIPTKVKPYYPNVIRFITKTGTSYSVPQTILTKVYYLIAPDNFPLIEQLPDSLGYISPSALMAFKDAFKELPNAKILFAPQVTLYSGELATISIQGESYTYETSVLSTVQRDRTTIVVDYEYELLLEGEQYKGRNQIALPSEYATYTKAHTFSAKSEALYILIQSKALQKPRKKSEPMQVSSITISPSRPALTEAFDEWLRAMRDDDPVALASIAKKQSLRCDLTETQLLKQLRADAEAFGRYTDLDQFRIASTHRDQDEGRVTIKTPVIKHGESPDGRYLICFRDGEVPILEKGISFVTTSGEEYPLHPHILTEILQFTSESDPTDTIRSHAGFQGVISSSGFAAFMDEIRRLPGYRMESNPRVETLSGNPARIIIGSAVGKTVIHVTSTVLADRKTMSTRMKCTRESGGKSLTASTNVTLRSGEAIVVECKAAENGQRTWFVVRVEVVLPKSKPGNASVNASSEASRTVLWDGTHR